MQRLEIVLWLNDAVLHRLEHGLKRGDRGAQIVARPRDQFTAGLEHLLEMSSHGIERLRQLGHLRRATLGGTGAQVTRRELVRRIADTLEVRNNVASKQNGADDAGGRSGG